MRGRGAGQASSRCNGFRRESAGVPVMVPPAVVVLGVARVARPWRRFVSQRMRRQQIDTLAPRHSPGAFLRRKGASSECMDLARGCRPRNQCRQLLRCPVRVGDRIRGSADALASGPTASVNAGCCEIRAAGSSAPCDGDAEVDRAAPCALVHTSAGCRWRRCEHEVEQRARLVGRLCHRLRGSVAM